MTIVGSLLHVSILLKVDIAEVSKISSALQAQSSLLIKTVYGENSLALH